MQSLKTVREPIGPVIPPKTLEFCFFKCCGFEFRVSNLMWRNIAQEAGTLGTMVFGPKPKASEHEALDPASYYMV